MMRANFRHRRSTGGRGLAVLRIATCIALIAGRPAIADDSRQNGPEQSPAVELPGAGDRPELESLFARWQGRQSEIVTARIEYRSFHNSVEGGKSVAGIAEILDAGGLDSSPEGFRAFIAAVNGGAYRIDPPWGEGRILIRDSQRRNDLGPFTTVEDSGRSSADATA